MFSFILFLLFLVCLIYLTLCRYGIGPGFSQRLKRTQQKFNSQRLFFHVVVVVVVVMLW